MQHKPRYAFFVSSLNSGGIENYLLRFLTHYQDDFFATVYCKSNVLGDLKSEYEAVGAEIIPIKLSYINVALFFKLFKKLKQGKYDAVCDFTGNFAGIIMFISRLVNIKNRITFYRGSDNHFNENFFKLAYNKFVWLLVSVFATDILSNSNTALEYFFPKRNMSDSRFEVIYNGIDSAKFLSSKLNLREELNVPKDAFVVGHVGRFNLAKNHDTIIKVAIELCSKNPLIYFVLCGEGVPNNLTAVIEKAKLHDQIKTLGYRKDVVKVLNTYDCFYFPSLTEGQPNALIEALVAGLPFVASNIKPIKETIPINYHNQLVPPLAKEKAIEAILNIYNSANRLNLKEWAINNYSHKFWFQKFYDRLK